MEEKEPEFYELSDFKSYLETDKNLSLNTVEAYLTDLKFYAQFLKKYEHVFSVEDIDTQMIEKYMLSLKRKNLSKQTISRKLTSIKEFHKFLKEENITKDNPAKLVDNVKHDKKLPSVLSEEEVTKMIESINGDTPIDLRNRAILEIMYGSGLRVSEV